MSEATPYELGAVAPLIVVSVGAVAALALESVLRPAVKDGTAGRSAARVGAALSLFSAGVLSTAIVVAVNAFASGASRSFHPEASLVVLDPLAAFASAIVAGTALGSVLLSARYLGKFGIHHGETYALLLLAVAGMILLVSAGDLVTLFLGVEGMCLPLYVLVALDRHRRTSSEGALEFALLGMFASALGLFGIALLYGETGATGFADVRAALPEAGPFGAVGVALVCAGLAFRIAAVPLHAWAPDVEEGAPTPIAAFVSAGLKTAAFVALFRVSRDALGPLDAALADVFRVLSAGTMLVGSVMAVAQENLKRRLAYVGIANGGLLLTAFLAETDAAAAALLFALVAFAFTNLGAFGVLTVMSERAGGGENIDDLTGLAQRRPALAAAATLFWFSLAGIPGTAGFIAKLQLLSEAVRAGEMGLVLLSGIANLILLYAVLRLPVAMYMNPPALGASRPRLGSGESVVLILCAGAVILLGLAPNGAPLFEPLTVIDWARAAGLP